MSIYHQHFITIPGFKDYKLSDQGHVYHKGTNLLMEPLIIKGVKTYVNKYGKYLMITQQNGEWFYTTCQKGTEKIARPERLSLNFKVMLEASITLRCIEHVKYFPNNKQGIADAIKWGEDLEMFYYPN